MKVVPKSVARVVNTVMGAIRGRHTVLVRQPEVDLGTLSDIQLRFCWATFSGSP